MASSTLRLSVIVCAYNEERYVASCLHSLLAQTRPPDEIILIDNASQDRTGHVGRAIPGVRVIHEARKGLVVARETGLAQPSWDDLPEMAGYLMLGAAMFLALLLQTVRVWAIPLLIALTGLIAELILHNLGMTVQVLTPGVLLVAIGWFAVVSLGAAVRHG